MDISHKNALLIGGLAGLIGACADVLLLYSPNGGYHTFDYKFLQDIAPNRMLAGHYLGVLFIPLEIFGFWALTKRMDNIRLGQRLLLAAIFATILGVAYHGQLLWVAQALANNADLQQIKWWFEPLSWCMAVPFGAFALIWGRLAFRGEVGFPKWLAWLNPAITYLCWIVLYILVPIIGNLIIVAGFNLSVALLLLGGYVALKDAR